MSTTIQITEGVKKTLDKMKMFNRETYNDVLERMIEDELELNNITKREIEEAKKRIKSGKFLRHTDVEKKLGF